MLHSSKQETDLIDATRLKIRDKFETPDIEIVTATSGAISTDLIITVFDTTLGASTSTLANGEQGQWKICYMLTDGGNQVLTPANLSNGTTITFDDVNDTWIGIFLNGSWVSIVATATIA